MILCLQKAKLKKPFKEFSDTELEEMKLKYYSPEVHVASFVLPLHMKKVSLTFSSLSFY